MQSNFKYRLKCCSLSPHTCVPSTSIHPLAERAGGTRWIDYYSENPLPWFWKPVADVGILLLTSGSLYVFHAAQGKLGCKWKWNLLILLCCFNFGLRTDFAVGHHLMPPDRYGVPKTRCSGMNILNHSRNIPPAFWKVVMKLFPELVRRNNSAGGGWRTRNHLRPYALIFQTLNNALL